MQRLSLALRLAGSVLILHGCGGSSSSPPPPPATHLSVAATSVTVTAGTPFNITVIALDASGAVVPTYPGTVHFTSSDAQAVLPANSTLTSGTGTFSVTLKTAGGQTIAATDTVTNSISGTSITISVSQPATHFSVTAPASATAGTAFNFTATALDASNNTATSYSGTVHFASTDGQAVLPANSTLANGTGMFSATLKTLGGQTLTASDIVNTSITGTSNSISVIGPATHFSLTAPSAVTTGNVLQFYGHGARCREQCGIHLLRNGALLEHRQPGQSAHESNAYERHGHLLGHTENTRESNHNGNRYGHLVHHRLFELHQRRQQCSDSFLGHLVPNRQSWDGLQLYGHGAQCREQCGIHLLWNGALHEYGCQGFASD
jgi:hypothetical protein